jgi:hypothetical protein
MRQKPSLTSSFANRNGGLRKGRTSRAHSTTNQTGALALCFGEGAGQWQMRDVVAVSSWKRCRGALTGSLSRVRVSRGAVGGVRTCDGVRVRLLGGRVTVRGGVVARWRGSHALEGGADGCRASGCDADGGVRLGTVRQRAGPKDVVAWAGGIGSAQVQHEG